MSQMNVPRCPRCLLPLSAPGVHLTEEGICNVCNDYQPAEPKGLDALRQELAYTEDRAGQYDCLVPISGGLDSFYTAFYLTRQMGSRCLGVHYDNGVGSDSKQRALSWAESQLGLTIVRYTWSTEKTQKLIRDSLRSLLPFGPQTMQAALCRHCGYGIRAAVYREMVARELHSVWGIHSMDAIPFRYCRPIAFRQQLLSPKRSDALRAQWGRFQQMRALPAPGMSPIRLMTGEFGYPAMPASHSHLKSVRFFDFVRWDKGRMLAELDESGVDTRWFTQSHSDCAIAPLVDHVLRAAWTVGKKEIYVCNRVRAGQLTSEEGMELIDAIRGDVLDISFFREIGLSDQEISQIAARAD